ncbi:MAG TPA: reverse transcriptase domain-containing protein, partial [Methylomicrobium sp.]|nr:reverse transcriptase domain-containing protein [Methylomicrobium sp.]
TDFVVAKLDFSNAFNCLHRDTMLDAVRRKVPEIYKYCHLSYSSSSILFFGTHKILSQEGTQQGEPLGPLLFCLSAQPLLSSLKARLSLGYMDDFTIGGPEADVAKDVQAIIEVGERIGLHLNTTKCEIIHAPEYTVTSRLLDSFVHVPPPNASLLGAPLFNGSALDSVLLECCDDLATAIDRLKTVGAHDALILLRSSLSAPKIQHLLRCSPCVNHQSLAVFDDLLRSAVSSITNCELSDIQWLQASLPVRDGGLGVRRAQSLALPSFIASATSTKELQAAILSEPDASEYAMLSEYMQTWANLYVGAVPNPPASFKQSTWDRPGIEHDKATVWNSFNDPVDKCRLAAVSTAHSGDWLHALPISACGLRLDDEAVRVAVGLRLGTNLCIPHLCPCGLLVGATGSHSLSCKLAFGRMVRHQSLNDIIYRAFVSANIPVTKEPVGLFRTDGKRPDGLTLIPWQAGKPLTWDVTVTHTLADSYVPNTFTTPGGAAEMAANRKTDKYAALAQTHIFQPLAFETLGPINTSGQLFLNELGRRISQTTGDTRETSYLFQRLSVTVQRFNSVAFQSGFIAPAYSDS